MLRLLVAVTLLSGTTVFAEPKLLLLQTIWRHGDRAPMGTFKTDKFKENDWEVKYGELLKRGIQRHFELGKEINKKYVGPGKLLESYKPYEVYVRSTDRNRTLLSATANLLGTFGENQTAKYDDIVGWPKGYVPIPIHTIDPQEDTLLDPLAPCPRSNWLWKLVMESEFFKNLTEENKEILTYFSNYTGVEINLDNIWRYYDAIYIELRNQKEANFNVTIFNQIEKLKKLIDDMEDGLYLPEINGININKEMPKVRGGYLVNTIANFMEKKWSCMESVNQSCQWIKNRKYNAYSAHDNTITAVLAALGNKTAVIKEGYPFYAACIFLELSELDNKKPGVRLLFYQEEDEIKDYRKIPGTNGIESFTNIIRNCEKVGKDGYCDLEKFLKTARESDPGDIKQLCNKVPDENKNKTTSASPRNTFWSAVIITHLFFWISYSW